MCRWGLPRGVDVFTGCPDVLLILELVLGGLVWILIALSQVPLPMFQGWVMFVSVFCFISTTALLFVYITGAHGGETSWETLETVYHSLATLFYLSASILEGLAANIVEYNFDFTSEQYLENIIATDSLYHRATAILYMSAAVLRVHAMIVSETQNPSNYFVNSTASFLAFVTALLYILQAFSNYYH